MNKWLETHLPANSDPEQVPTLWQWIKLFLDADETTRKRQLESAQVQAEIEAKLKEKLYIKRDRRI
jgi:hypothetical protein